MFITFVHGTVAGVCPASLLKYAETGVPTSEHLASRALYSIGGLLRLAVHPEDANPGQHHYGLNQLWTLSCAGMLGQPQA